MDDYSYGLMGNLTKRFTILFFSSYILKNNGVDLSWQFTFQMLFPPLGRLSCVSLKVTSYEIGARSWVQDFGGRFPISVQPPDICSFVVKKIMQIAYTQISYFC